MSRLRLQLLGRPRLLVDGERLRITCSRKVFELLGFVVTGPHGKREREEIASTLWPDLDDADARAALRRHLHHLSAALAPVGLSALKRGSSWIGVADGLEIDIRDFAGQNGAVEEAGDFLEGYHADWIAEKRAAIHERVVSELRRHVESAHSRGQPDVALAYARRLERFDPYLEQNSLLIAELLARSGDTAGALRQCEALERRLRETLGAPIGSGVLGLRDRLLRERAREPLHAFPFQSTRFIGREAEVRELLAMVETRRLVSCVGAPGVGKTRLASHVAEEFARSHAQPAFFVDVTHCNGAEQIAEALAAIVRREFDGGSLSNGPLERLEQSAALVLFDNAERIAGALGEVALELLRNAPQLRIIVTSRIPLHVDGEALSPVAPLGADDAAELFMDRARLVRPAAPGTTRTASTIRALCERVDGVPLAIELIAAQLRTLTLFQLAAAPIRHSGTLRATFDASLELLDDESRSLFVDVASFRGSFSAEDAAALTKGRPDRTEDRLATLVDHSLLTLESPEAQTARYFVLAPLREYAWTLLAAAGQEAALRERHARLFAARYVDRTEELNKNGELYAREVDRDHENISAALETLVTRGVDVVLGGQLCLAMQHLWFVTGRVVEGARWVAAVLAKPNLDPELRIRLLFMRSLMARHQTDYAVAIEGYREVISLRRAQAREEKVAATLLHLSGCLSAVGDVAGAMRAAREAEEYFNEHPDAYYNGYVAATLGLAALRGGDPERAESEFRDSLRYFQSADLELDIASSLSNLGSCALARGELDAAVEFAREAIERAQPISASFIAAASQVTIAIVACQSGEVNTARRHTRQALETALATNDYERLAELLEVGVRIAVLDGAEEAGTRLLGAADGVRKRCRAVRMAIDDAALASWISTCSQALGESRFAALRLAGESLRAGDAVAALRQLLDAER